MQAVVSCAKTIFFLTSVVSVNLSTHRKSRKRLQTVAYLVKQQAGTEGSSEQWTIFF